MEGIRREREIRGKRGRDEDRKGASVSRHGGAVRHSRGNERGAGDYNFESADMVMLEHSYVSLTSEFYIRAKSPNRVLYCYLYLYSFQGDKRVGMLIEWETSRIRE